MNREQIENMPAGRKMDNLIAEHVFRLEKPAYPNDDKFIYMEGSLGYYRFASPYSTDISAAWQVVEKMREKSGVVLSDFLNNDWSCHFVDAGKEIVAETLPLAICRAALLAVSS